MKNTKSETKKDLVKMSRGSFKREHVHLVKVLKKGSNKEQKEEGEDQERELKAEEKKKITPKKKSTAIENKKDNYDKKRTTSNGYLVKH